jgi:cyclophilin family peptidyl-prolyl cis-trans isomerase
VGTAKRERKKANRQARQEELARQAKQQKIKKIGLRVGIAVIVVLGALFVVSRLWGGGDDATPTATTVDLGFQPDETTVPGDTTEPTETTAPGETTQPPTTEVGTTPCPPAEGTAERVGEFDGPPPLCLEDGATYRAEITTNVGSFTVELDAERAPITVNNFVFLARHRFFDGTDCHRAIPNFVVQCGDPTATGSGGPGYRFVDELPEAGEYQVGSLAMANSGPNTNGSQFFVITGDDGAALPPSYSLFGQVVDGLDTTVAEMDARGNPNGNGVPPLQPITIESVRIIQG